MNIIFNLFLHLFDDNLATGGSLTGAILSCHVEISKHNARKTLKNKKEMQKRIHCIIRIQYSISKLHQQYQIQHLKRRSTHQAHPLA